jgi:hypothetical protein
MTIATIAKLSALKGGHMGASAERSARIVKIRQLVREAKLN